MVLAIAVHFQLPVFHADVPQAFLRAMMDTEMYMTLPKGVNLVDVNDPSKSTLTGYVIRLLRSLYGLKQSPQLWNKELDRFFTKYNFHRADAETSLYYRTNKATGKFVIVLSEVDDLVVTGNCDKMINEFRTALIGSFASKSDDGKSDPSSIAWENIKSFLGIDINYDKSKGIMSFNVKAKIDNLFKTHEKALHKLGTASIPLPTNFQESEFAENGVWTPTETYLKEKYASIVGAVIYLSITCRPDISYVVGRLSRGMHKPTRAHVNLLKSLLKYLNCHRDTPLVYKSGVTEAHRHFKAMVDSDLSLFSVSGSYLDNGFDINVGFTDADFARSHLEQRRSTSGYCFFVFGNLVAWKSKLQPLTAKSTHEAELIALSFASDEGVWMRRFLKEIRFSLIGKGVGKMQHVNFPLSPTDAADGVGKDCEKFLNELPPTPIFEDNKGTWATVNNPISTAQGCKHLDTRYFGTRDHIREGRLRVHFLRTHLNVADFFTKGLPNPAYSDFKRVLMGSVSNNY